MKIQKVKTEFKKSRIIFLVAMMFISIALVVGAIFTTTSVDVQAFSDGMTLNQWQTDMSESNKHVGRIWTDKSVSEQDVKLDNSNIDITLDTNNDESFLVALSALSSTSSQTVSTSQPLDIVLALDVSGSMKNDLSGNTYTEVYSPDPEQSYYIKNGNGYKEVSWSNWRDGWFDWYGTEYTPKTSADDSEDGHVQFYSRKKIDALKTAVGNFLNYAQQQNNQAGTDLYHVGLVKFASDKRDTVGNDIMSRSGYNYTQIVSHLTKDISGINNYVQGFSAAGATSADYALEHVQTVLNNSAARPNAKKVVIFFTDGEPNHHSGFDEDVANEAIKTAKSIKESGTTIYSIGVFSDADPNDVNRPFNGYMHGVSSNYPNAETYTNLGTRAEGSDYYKAASDAEELNKIFEEIAKDTANPESPTHIENPQNPASSGYITFEDQLGDFMELKSVKGVVFADQLFENKEDNNNIRFEGDIQANEVYPDGHLSDVKMTYNQQTNTVRVMIPATMIPLRYYDITSKNGTTEMTIKEALPIRIFYAVGLKDNVEEQLSSGNITDSQLQTYVDNHSQNGKTRFYSNAFDIGDKGKTTAKFTPAKTNSFYYYVEDTKLYTDEELKTRATGPYNPNTTYYYANEYYDNTTGETVSATEAIAITGAPEYYIGNDGQGLYVEKGNHKVTRAQAFQSRKEENISGTANYSIYPEWGAQEDVTVYLGNNGYIEKDVYGQLSISKTVQGEGAPANDEFEFTIHLDGYQNQEITGKIGETEHKLSFDSSGDAKVNLKDGQTFIIPSIKAGTQYTVTETSKSDYQSQPANDIGTINPGRTSAVVFTNTYHVDPVILNGQTNLQINKLIDGRDWLDDDSFTFKITPDSNTQQAIEDGKIDMPTDTTLTIDATTPDHKASFGDITFNAKGTYIFFISENDTQIPGMSDDETRYTVQINVTDDDRNGKLETNVTYKKGNDQFVYNDSLTFTNTYNAQATTVSIQGLKTLNAGGRTLKDKEFSFKLQSVKVDDNEEITSGTPENVPLPANIRTIGDTVQNSSASALNINFGVLKLDSHHVGHTYTYSFKEIKPSESNGTDEVNMTYDEAVKTVVVTVSSQQINGIENVVANVTNDQSADGYDQNTRMVFTNTYTASGILSGNDKLQFKKILSGRDWKDGDSFKFTISGSEGAPMPSEQSVTLEYNQAAPQKNGEAIESAFGNINFDQNDIGKTYTYTIAEEEGTIAGVTYSKDKYKVEVKVSDGGNGQLNLETKYLKNDAAIADGNIVFTNSYTPTFNNDTAVTLNGTKQLTVPAESDKTLVARQFAFDISGAKTASVTNDKGGEPEITTENKIYKGNISILNQETYSAPGEYVYEIRETIPATVSTGYTYDETSYRITVTVTDDQNGNLVASDRVKVAKSTGKDSDGHYSYGNDEEVLSEDVKDKIIFANSYKPSSITTSDPANDGIQINKTVTGNRELGIQEGEFTFTLTGKAIGQSPADGFYVGTENTQSEVKATASGNGVVAFSNITFTKAGTYEFTVKENTGQDSSIIYDTHEYIVTYVVTDKNGKLSIQKTTSNSANFKNQYHATGTLDGTNLVFNKVLSGRDWKDGDSFKFTISGSEGAPMPSEQSVTLEYNQAAPQKNGEAIESAFGNINFDQNDIGKTYTYTIAEEEGTIAGVTYSKDKYKVEVKVSDGGNGQLNLETKYLKNDAEIAYGNIVFTNSYKIIDKDYKIDDAIKLKKELIGKAWDQEIFTFNIKQTSGPTSVHLEKTSVQVSKPANGNIADFTFGDMTFTEVGEYVFEVTEEQGNINGLVYSTQKAIITINVTDNLNGGFTHSLTSQNTVFKNVYTYGTISGLQITKSLSGLDMTKGDFTFIIEATNQESASKAGMTGMSSTVTNGDATQVSGVSTDVMSTLLNNMTFTSDDNGKNYQYTISEEKGNKDYIEYDSTQYHVTISPTVVDDITTIKTTVEKDGVSTVYDNQLVTLSFANKYDTSTILGPNGSVQIEATKELINGNLTDNQFTFNVVDKSGSIVSTGTNDAKGVVSFNDIEYTIDKILEDVKNGIATMTIENGQTIYSYSYTVKEGQLPNGITAIAGEFNIIVKITDNEQGELTINVEYPNNSDNKLSFINEYGRDTKATVIINGSKKLTADEGTVPPSIDGKFTFTMQAEDITDEQYRKDKDGNVVTRAIIPQPAKLTQNNDSSNSIRFDEIEYDMSIFDGIVASDDGTRQATFKYTITESGKVDGITNDKNDTRIIKVKVIDNGDGTLSATGDTVFEFTNHYSVDPKDSSITDVDSGITLNKTLVGRELIENEFEFVMSDQTNNIVSTGKNDADGKVVMTPITFKKEGTYNYNLYEKQDGKGGIVYDNTLYVAKAHVVDQHNGKLTVSWELLKDNQSIQNVNFENTYSAKATSVNIVALKKLNGRSLKDKEFTFELSDQNGKVIEQVQNDGNGNIQFTALTFDKPGTYTYMISEVKGEDKDITYDQSVKNVTVTVTDDGLGQLNAVVTSDELVFTNNYTQPAVEGIETGDAMQIAEWLSATILSILCILVVYRKKFNS